MVYDKLMTMEPNEVVNFIESVKFNDTLYCFDYSKAVEIIKTNNIRNAEFGLNGDWTDSHAICLKNGYAVMDTTAYLNSTWGIPTLRDMDTGKEYSCYFKVSKSNDDYDTRSEWNEDEQAELNDGTHQQKLI